MKTIIFDFHHVYLYYQSACLNGGDGGTTVITDMYYSDDVTCPGGWSSGPGGSIDLNADAGGDYIYLCLQYGYDLECLITID